MGKKRLPTWTRLGRTKSLVPSKLKWVGTDSSCHWSQQSSWSWDSRNPCLSRGSFKTFVIRRRENFPLTSFSSSCRLVPFVRDWVFLCFCCRWRCWQWSSVRERGRCCTGCRVVWVFFAWWFRLCLWWIPLYFPFSQNGLYCMIMSFWVSHPHANYNQLCSSCCLSRRAASTPKISSLILISSANPSNYRTHTSCHQ
jgi:hypothetical protein